MNRSSQFSKYLPGITPIFWPCHVKFFYQIQASNRIIFSTICSRRKKIPPLAAGCATKHIPCGLFFIFLFCLFSATVRADAISDIKIFYNDDIEVDLNRFSKGYVLHTYNLDDKKHSQIALSKIIGDQVSPLDLSENGIELAHREAFSQLQNGDHWPALYKKILSSIEPEVMAIKYGIKKIPAIVINNEKVFYGVSSLEEAIDIYNGLSDE